MKYLADLNANITRNASDKLFLNNLFNRYIKKEHWQYSPKIILIILRIYNMSTETTQQANQLDSIFSDIKALFEDFNDNHVKHSTKGNKAAGARARASIGALKKLVVDYRKASVESDKLKAQAK